MQSKRVVGPTWGLTPHSPKTCLQIMTYCVSGQDLERAHFTQNDTNKIRQVQVRALRLMTAPMPRIRTPAKIIHLRENAVCLGQQGQVHTESGPWKT